MLIKCKQCQDTSKSDQQLKLISMCIAKKQWLRVCQ